VLFGSLVSSMTGRIKMDRSLMVIGLITVFTSLAGFILSGVYYCLPDRIKVMLQLPRWMAVCLVCWLFGLLVFGIGYLIL